MRPLFVASTHASAADIRFAGRCPPQGGFARGAASPGGLLRWLAGRRTARKFANRVAATAIAIVPAFRLRASTGKKKFFPVSRATATATTTAATKQHAHTHTHTHTHRGPGRQKKNAEAFKGTAAARRAASLAAQPRGEKSALGDCARATKRLRKVPGVEPVVAAAVATPRRDASLTTTAADDDADDDDDAADDDGQRSSPAGGDGSSVKNGRGRPAGLLRWPTVSLASLFGDLERHVLGHMTLDELVRYRGAGRRSRAATTTYLERATHLHLRREKSSADTTVACTAKHRRGRALAARHCRSLRHIVIGHSINTACGGACTGAVLRGELSLLVARNRATLEWVAGEKEAVRHLRATIDTDDTHWDAALDDTRRYRSLAVASAIARSCPRLQAPFYVDDAADLPIESAVPGAAAAADDESDDNGNDDDDDAVIERRRRADLLGFEEQTRLLLDQVTTHAHHVAKISLVDPQGSASVTVERTSFVVSRDAMTRYLAANPQLTELRLAGGLGVWRR